MKWKVKEIIKHLFAEFPSKEVCEFLNTLPEDRALEAKISMMSNSPLVYIYYRE